VRVIEDGDVRTVIEALFKYGDSFIVQTYKLPKRGTEIQVQLKVNWNEKSKMLKLSVPTIFEDAAYKGQVAYGYQDLPSSGAEAVSQKWSAVVSEKSEIAFTCINDSIYGSDYKDGEMRISLLRSPAYSGHPIENRPILVQDRYLPRIDQGEREFSFWFNAGSLKECLESVDREALVYNEKPFALSFFPSGMGQKPLPLVTLSDKAIQMTAFKKSENSQGYILRLFEPTGAQRTTKVNIPSIPLEKEVTLQKFEIKTFKISKDKKELVEVDLLEKEL
jgi:alpha-mannosidase